MSWLCVCCVLFAVCAGRYYTLLDNNNNNRGDVARPGHQWPPASSPFLILLNDQRVNSTHTHTCCWFIHLFVCTHSAAAARTRTMGHNRKSTDKKKKKKKLISFACHRPPLLLFTNVCRIIIIDAWRVVEIAAALPPFVVWTQTKEKKNI